MHSWNQYFRSIDSSEVFIRLKSVVERFEYIGVLEGGPVVFQFSISAQCLIEKPPIVRKKFFSLLECYNSFSVIPKGRVSPALAENPDSIAVLWFGPFEKCI